MDSKRLPGKPLLDVNGKPLLQWTYEAAKKTTADLVIVTTPDREIVDYCCEHDITVIRTDKNISNGTIRCCMAVEQFFPYDKSRVPKRVVNWQVDEPFVDPTYIDRMFNSDSDCIHTLVSPKESNGTSNKVIVNDEWTCCHWFTREPIPGAAYHCGVYSFPWKTLQQITTLVPTEKAMLESLEQLTWLENGFQIVPIPMYRLPLSIDTQEDLDEFRRITKKK